jgi:hypothetical protein
MAGSSYIKRDTASGLTNTGGDTGEATEFVKLMNKGSATSVNVTMSVATNSTEKAKWITPTGIPGNLDWANGTYTWRWNCTAIQATGSILEVILRRLSSDGATVRASKSSGALTAVTFATTGVKSGTIDWNDDTQNPLVRTIDDRLEVVFRINNSNVLAAATMTVGTNVVADDAITTPIIYFRSVTDPAITVSDTVARLRRRKGIPSEPAVTVSETLTRFARKKRTDAESVIVSETATRKKFVYRTETEPTISVSETVTRKGFKNRTVAQTVTVGADTVARVAKKFRNISETVIVSESVSRVRAAIRAVSESIGGGGGGPGGVNKYYVIINETIPIGDVVTAVAKKFRGVSESVDIGADTTSRQVKRPRTIAEPAITISDSTDRKAFKRRNITEERVNIVDHTEVHQTLRPEIITVLKSVEQERITNVWKNRLDRHITRKKKGE